MYVKYNLIGCKTDDTVISYSVNNKEHFPKTSIAKIATTVNLWSKCVKCKIENGDLYVSHWKNNVHLETEENNSTFISN